MVDATFQLVRGHYVPMLVLSAIMTAPTLLVAVVGADAIRAVATPRPGTLEMASAHDTAIVLLSLLPASLWFFVVDGALVWYAAQVYLGRPADPGTAMREALSRTWRLIASNVSRLLFIMLGTVPFLFGIGIATALVARPLGAGNRTATVAVLIATLLAMLLIVGWFVFAIARYFVAAPVLMLEDAGPIAALRRSASLMKGGKRRAAALLVLAFAVYMAISLLVAVPLGLTRTTAISQVGRVIVQVLLYPLFATLVAVVYYDQRVRREAFDIELMSNSLGAAGAV